MSGNSSEITGEVLAQIYAPPLRRWLGVGALLCLGGLLIFLAITQPPANPLWLGFLILFGAACIWAGDVMRRSTALGLTLTDVGLYDSTGLLITSLDDIENVDRSVFAFKPSNGFLLKLKSHKPRRWQPGLYWITGRRIGVGGVTSRGQAKMMADTIALTLAERRTSE